MINEAKEKCPTYTPIPSKSLVRLQFAPRNPYAKTSWNFTSRIDVQYKIQTRQLRLTHPDEHFCNAQFRYFKEYAIEMSEKCKLILVCCDDKAKVPIGEPGFAVSTGVRGKKTVTPSSSTLTAADHDMTKSSLTPSVTLQCKIPTSSEDSFVRGKVTVTVNDSVFQSSNPFRHAVSTSKILANQGDINILMKYTDGGTDHRNTLESVKCASICLFKEMNLDMLILGRCAPGHSWRNPAERVMSLLNLGLQNCSLERAQCNEEIERKLKKMGSMKEIRNKADADVKKGYQESVEPVQSIIRNRFTRLRLKDEPVSVMDPISDMEIDVFQRHLRELFPEMNLQKLTKQETNKIASYVQWKARHCRERHYTFQIKKCNDPDCCLPSLDRPMTELQWLPDPMLLDDKEHFRSFQDSKETETDERDRPTSVILDRAPKAQRNRSTARSSSVHVNSETEMVEADLSANAEPNDEVGQILNDETSNNPAASVDPGGEPRGNALSQVEQPINEETEPLSNAELHAEPPCTAEPRVEQLPSDDPFLYTGQNARGVVRCVECRKPRVYYCKNKLSARQIILLDRALTEFDYTCGAPLSDPDDIQSVLKHVAARKNLSCCHPVELAYYSSSIGRRDVCCYCGDQDGYVDDELDKKYKTVLPICQECKNKGKSVFVQRPYGKRP